MNGGGGERERGRDGERNERNVILCKNQHYRYMRVRDQAERKDSVLFCFKSQIRARGMGLYSEGLKFSLCFATQVVCPWASHFPPCLNFLFCKMKIIKLTIFFQRGREMDFILYLI